MREVLSDGKLHVDTLENVLSFGQYDSFQIVNASQGVSFCRISF